VEIVVEGAEPLLEPADVLAVVALDGGTGEAEAILLGKPITAISCGLEGIADA
jgi:hypothetical protein